MGYQIKYPTIPMDRYAVIPGRKGESRCWVKSKLFPTIPAIAVVLWKFPELNMAMDIMIPPTCNKIPVT